jgi:hypothetical protein
MSMRQSHYFVVLVASAVSALMPQSSPAQITELPKQQLAAAYTSAIDQRLTIRKVTVLPATDNTDGIYARPIESLVVELVKSSHRWEFTDSKINSLAATPLELEESSQAVRTALGASEADAAILPVITRGPTGLAIRLSLFMKVDGKMLAQEITKDHSRFELADVKGVVASMYRRLIRTIPYEGLVLSRQGTRVTLNLGKADGVKVDQSVSVIQVISENRHPKFGLLISTEKEILGQIRILKVDDTLSFGVITSEKERGAIQKLAKIAGVNAVEYGSADFGTGSLSSGSENNEGINSESDLAFGKKAKEWLPIKQPAFGLVGIKAALGTYAASTNLNSVGSLDGKSDFFPMLSINAELWLNPQWSILAEVTQGILSLSNPRGGSAPSTLNHAMSKYSMSVGYNFLIRDQFFGPKFQLRSGINFYRMFVDDSTPESFTTVNFNGYLLGLGLYFPMSDFSEIDLSKWAVGGEFIMTLFSKLSESPVTSGSSASNTINEFNLFLERQIAINVKARLVLDFALYSSNLSGSGTRAESATSLSQRYTSLGGGIIYQF